jgi:hypothetical protein
MRVQGSLPNNIPGCAGTGITRIEALEASVRLRVPRHRRMPRICLARPADVPCCETYMELCPVCVRSFEQQSSKVCYLNVSFWHASDLRAWSASPVRADAYSAAAISKFDPKSILRRRVAEKGRSGCALIHARGRQLAQLGGIHPTRAQAADPCRAVSHSPSEIASWFEQTTRCWNEHPTPFVWNGKRRRRRFSHGAIHRLGGSGACTRKPLPQPRSPAQAQCHIPWRTTC